MPWKPKIRPPLIKCGDCGKPRRVGERHVCVTRMDRKPRKGKTRVVRARVEIWTCPDCKKPAGPGHQCIKKTDFRKRKKDAEAERKKREAAERRKAAAAKRKDSRHEPRECEDPDCGAYGCRCYRDGYQDGNATGWLAGQIQGYAEGHADGYAAGRADGASAE